MVLARTVCRPEGPALLGEGQKLTDALIERVRSSGVSTIWVEGNPLGPEGGVGDLAVVARSLPFLFRRHENDVFMMTLRNVFARHFAKRLAEQRALEDAAIERHNREESEATGTEE